MNNMRFPSGTDKEPQDNRQEFVRFSVMFRVQHIALFSSVIVLIVTGLPLRYATTRWTADFYSLIGGIQMGGFIHRVAAVVLMATGIAHMAYITLTQEGRREFRQLIPSLKDFSDVGKNVLYFLGLSKTRPKFGRYSYLEKFDYWAVYWGMVVMIGSGLMLWFHSYVMAFLPKYYVDIAREAHSDEALLATLAIVIWHFYNVHFNPRRFPMSWTWLTGKISKEEMLEEHPLEYEKIVLEAKEK